jgi:hypothetical protein
MNKPIPLPNTGKLDKNSDPLYVRSGDQTDCKGMDFAEEAVFTQTTQAGNVRVLNFGQATLQNQKTRINLPGVYADPVTITFLDINRNVRGTTTVATGGTLSGTKDAIITFLQSLPYSVEFESVSSTLPYLDVTVGYSYADYLIEVTNGTTDILEEAISGTGVGRFMPIGSYDLLDDVFFWLTTQRNVSTQIQNITSVYTSVNSQVGIASFEHELSDFDSVAIGSVVGVPGANGIYTVTVIDANNFYLNNSFFSGAYTSGGTGFKNIYGYGCIGVVVEDAVNDAFNFTPLLRSKRLNFVTKKQIYTPQVQASGDLIQMYYTDNYNVPRVTYYRGAYEVDGCIRVLYPNTGQYAYATLAQEISRQVNTNKFKFEIQDQIQSGGQTIAGNNRYAVRFLTDSLSPSELSLLTPSIPTFAPGYDSLNPATVYGSPSTVTTSKINRMLLSGITPGIFKYVELIYFQYLGEGQTTATAAFNIRRELLAENQTTIVLEHNGNEPSITFFDTQLANQVQPNIIRSADISIIDNRMVDVNVKMGNQVDISAWANTFMYSIVKLPLIGAYTGKTNYEFYDPMATVNHTSYQQYEWYRFYVSGRFKSSGALTNAFFAFDVRFVTIDDYNSFPDEFHFIDSNGYPRRELTGDEMNTYDLGNVSGDLFQFGLELKNIDWGFQINGVPVRDIFSEVCIFRAERVKEVLSDGQIVTSADTAIYQPSGSGAFETVLTEFPQVLLPLLTPVPEYTENRGFVTFYSPDLLFGAEDIKTTNGDQIINFGSLKLVDVFTGTPISTIYNSYLGVYCGLLGTSIPERTSVSSSVFISAGQLGNIGGQRFYKKQNATSAGGGEVASSLVIELGGTVSNVSLNVDDRKYRAIYFRAKKDKYGTANSQIQVLYTGYSIPADFSSGLVYGGDVFTQQTWFKNSYIQVAPPLNYGQAVGYNLISQNITNTNLRLWDSSLVNNQVFLVSTSNFLTWLGNVFPNEDQIADNAGYQLKNNVQYQAVYDPEGQDEGSYSSRTTYSELKPNNSKVDYFRVILPLSFQDAPEIQGEILRALVLNKTLFILQRRGFTHMYFNSQGTLISADAGQVLIGDGSVLQRIGTNLSEFGLAQSGALVRGRSQSGKDTAMWVNSTFTNVLRFGDDGIRNVSLRDNMRLFFNKNLRWANVADTPADGFGITGVWDNDNSNYVFTIKAWRPVVQWNGGVGQIWAAGSMVLNGFITQGIPQIWIANFKTESEPSDRNPAWTKVSIENPDYYNCFTFVYSEIKNGFTFYPYFLPNFYASWKGKFFTGYSDLENIQKSELYLHGDGNPNEFYGVTYDGGQVELVLNWQPNLNKKPLSLHINSNVKPARVEIQSLFRDNELGEVIKESFLLASDFETREGYQYAPIKLETDANGSNEGNSSDMEGVWTKFRIIFPAGVKCKINDSIALISITTRNFTK